MNRTVGFLALAGAFVFSACAESSAPPITAVPEATPPPASPPPADVTPAAPGAPAAVSPTAAAPTPTAPTPAAPAPAAGTPAPTGTSRGGAVAGAPAGTGNAAGRPVSPNGPTGPAGDPLKGGSAGGVGHGSGGHGYGNGGTSPCATVLCAAKKVCEVQANGQPRCVDRLSGGVTDGNTKPGACLRTGCSGTICSDTPARTTCEYKEQYACYNAAACERDAAGKCGWRQTAELTACLAKK